MNPDDARIDRTAFAVFTSFEEADEADRRYWWSRTPEERLAHLEYLRRLNYGDAATARLQRCLRLLNEHRVEYLLVGGYVVAHYGYARTTDDFDVWVRPDEANAERVVAALKAFGFDVPTVTPALFKEENQIVRMGIPPQRLELMTSISGVTFEACWNERVDTEWDGVPVHLLSLERLRENKRASGRTKDQADLDKLPRS